MRKIAASFSLPLFIAVLSTAALCQEQTLTGSDIAAGLADHTLQGVRDDGKEWQQIFQKSGVTYYSVGNAQSQGLWEVRGDQYCSQWPPNESWACYGMTRDVNTFNFISATGQRSSGKLLN
ncbi:MAG: hypothetical protein WCE69_03405 [Aestuariivirga sp.]